jgi:predicted transposase YbfD/YdcC
MYAALQAVPDPRHARGQRYAWPLLLTLVAAALASGQKQVWAIAHWAVLHAQEIIALLEVDLPRLPSASTLYRTVQRVDVTLLEQRLAEYAASLAAEATAPTVTLSTGATVRGQAIDGKEVRGASAHGDKVKLVSLVQHDTALTLEQAQVERRRGEQTTARKLLTGRDLRGTVTTMDAGLAGRRLVQQVLDQHGEYLVVIKANQRTQQDAIALLFEQPPWLPHERSAEYRCFRSIDKGHGRLETRQLESSPSLNDYLEWPGVQQVMRRTCRRVILKTGEVTEEVTYGLTSLGWHAATSEHLEHLWRAHWTIENRAHYVRDETMGEDRAQIHVGDAPHALAALRNGVLNALRLRGHTNIAAALREHAASVRKAFTLIGALPLRL